LTLSRGDLLFQVTTPQMVSALWAFRPSAPLLVGALLDHRRCEEHHRSRPLMSARVLVADDSSTMRKIILRSLSAVGVPSAVEAADGEEALNLFKPGEFDLVLTDWNMPRKNGLEVIQEVRKQDPNVTIIMVTTEAEKSRVLEAIQAGVSDYLVKPFTAETLREKLEKHGC
jgi:two-component system, chemotaxis family, chemotaxis protein CheY